MGKGTVRFVTSYVIKTILTTKACGEISKIQNGIINCDSQKVLYLLKCRMCGKALMLVRQKQNLEQNYLILNKVHLGPVEKYHNEHYRQHSHNGIDD